MTVEDLKNFFMAIDGSFEYLIENRQSRKSGHKTITVLQMN